MTVIDALHKDLVTVHIAGKGIFQQPLDLFLMGLRSMARR